MKKMTLTLAATAAALTGLTGTANAAPFGGNVNQREAQIERILRRLDEREQKIISSRFGLDHSHEPQTLKEVGASLGVTKERIRQIEARALSKLRQAAQEEKILLDTL